MGGHPTRQPCPDRDAEDGRIGVGGAHERALEADRFAHPGLVIDPIDADRVVLDERAGPGHDRLGDALDVLEPVQPAGELGDRLEPVGHRPGRFGQPGVADGGRHVVGEGARDLGLLGRPGVLAQVVQHEQAERRAAEHDRDEADGSDPGSPVDRPQPWHGRPEVAAEDLDLLVAERVHARRLRIARQGADDVEDLLRQATLRDDVERGRAVLEQPQACLVDTEQRERLVDDVAEEAVEVVAAADLGRDPAQRVGARRALRPGCERGLVAG